MYHVPRPFDYSLDEISSATSYLPCQNDPTGPYYRIQTDPSKTGSVNNVDGDVFIPTQFSTPSYVPYVYLGGQNPNGTSAVDAGLYPDENGAWVPVITSIYGPTKIRVPTNLPTEVD